MKRHMIALFALAATLAISPTAFGDTSSFSFIFSSVATTPPTCCAVNEIATGELFGTEIGNTGVYQITSGTISMTGSAFSGTGVIDTNPGDLSPFGADNELYFVGNGPLGSYLDLGGLLFSTTNGLNNLWAGDNNYSTTSYSLSYSTWDVDYPGTFNVSAPDGGMTMMLLGGALVGLEILRRRFRQ
jgi:hypothetical protein